MKPKLQGLAGELLKLSEIVHLNKNQALIKVPEEHKSLLIDSVLKKLKDGLNVGVLDCVIQPSATKRT